jgi:hypothetical protein
VHTSLYNFELYKLQHAEAQRLAADERWASTVRRANRRTRRSLFAKVTSGKATAPAATRRAVAN